MASAGPARACRREPEVLEELAGAGSIAPLMRSFCSRSMMMTSASRCLGHVVADAHAHLRQVAGTSVFGRRRESRHAQRGQRVDVGARHARVHDVADDRHRSCVKSPLKWRIVYMSSSPCVGCAWRPSPALTTCTCGAQCSRSGTAHRFRCGARRTCRHASPRGWRWCRAGSRPWRWTTCDVEVDDVGRQALGAISKVVRVRVLFSKNR